MTKTLHRGTAARTRARRLATLAMIATTTMVAGVAGLSACSGISEVPPPSDLVDSSQVGTQASALAMYNGALYNFAQSYAGSPGYGNDDYVTTSGLFADEFTTTVGGSYADKETHVPPMVGSTSGPYQAMHGARRVADEAIKNLRLYGAALPSSYIGELHALKGYIYIMMSELFCEGVPFSSLAKTGLVEFGDPETMIQMNNHAIAQFDSAMASAPDSTRILNLAAVGKGRAYVNLGDFVNAKAAVANVPTNFAYTLTYSTQYLTGNWMATLLTQPYYFWMADRKGGKGLDYVNSTDVRVAKTIIGGNPFPSKVPAANTPIPLANGVEARLIEAEAALRANDIPAWSTALNTLRATGGSTAIAALSADSTTTASDTMRVGVMFRERGFWLFATGHRQGDQRRLIRQYQRAPTSVYATGVLQLNSVPVAYFPTPVMEVPAAELTYNPKYHGCMNLGA